MNLFIIAVTLGVLGKVLLGVAVIRVHSHIMKEHRIDDDVINAIKRERYISIIAILFIIIGYLLEVTSYGAVFPV